VVEFFFLTFAVYRTTRLIIRDSILDSFRNKLWDRFPPESTKIGYLITCPWCIGFWLSLGFYICYTIVPFQTLWVCYVLALSAAVGLLTALEDRI
jgi:hypothetical protein